MKKRFLLLILMFFIIPISYANLEINEINPKTYNLGDKISLGGFVLRETSFNGFFKVNLNCQESSIPLISRTLSISANEKYNFLDEAIMPNILTGNCHLKFFLEENNNIIEEKISNEILISKELKGNFILINSKVQLGNDVDIRGEVYKINGKRIDGVANIYFKKDKKVLFINTKEIKDGNFDFKIPSNYVDTGSYSIDFNLKDSSGNENLVVDAINFDVTNLLNLELKIDKEKANPGSNFEINGVVKDIYGNSLSKGNFLIKFNEKEFKGNIVFGEFFSKINIDNFIKTGIHNILIEVFDENKNKGTGSLSINVLPRAENVQLNFEKDAFKPGDKVKAKAFIYDQGGDVLSKDIKIEVRNSNNEKIIDKIVKNDFEFDLSLNSKPGEWKINAESGNLKTEKKFYVSEVENLVFSVDGQNLVISNSGNVEFNENLNIKLEGIIESLVINKKIYLEPGKSTSLDLGNEVSTGIYKVIINDKLFDNVKIEGKSIVFYKTNYNIIFIAIVLLILGLLILKKKNIFGRRFLEKGFSKKDLQGNQNIRKESNFGNYLNDVKRTVQKQVEQKERFVKKEIQNLKPKNFKNYVEIKPRAEKLDDFRKRSSYLNRRKKEKEQKDFDFKEGMFDMFK